MNRRHFIKNVIAAVGAMALTPVIFNHFKSKNEIWRTALIIGVRNGNDRIYPVDVFEKALAEYRTKIEKTIAIGIYDTSYKGYFPEADQEKASHLITDARIVNGNEVQFRIRPFETPNGKSLSRDLDIDGAVEFRCSGNGSLCRNSDGIYVVQSDYTLISVDAYPARAGLTSLRFIA